MLTRFFYILITKILFHNDDVDDKLIIMINDLLVVGGRKNN
jgi:hypothetical protein